MTRRQRRLSIIICVYNMAREAPRTVLSATRPYQKDVCEDDFEVIIVDNGSTTPPPAEWVASLPANAKFIKMPSPQPSPVFAMNWAARSHATGEFLMFAIDGARIFSDRLWAGALRAHETVDDAFVYTLAWHLGPKVQMISSTEGYDETVEDDLIKRSGWPDNPDALFDVSVFAGSSAGGFFRPISESNSFSVSRKLFERIGGYDERFTSPGAGLANLEIFRRYVLRPGARNVCLLGQGTFHQFHGGVATSGKVRWPVFREEYQRIFNEAYKVPHYETLYFGQSISRAKAFLGESVEALGR